MDIPIQKIYNFLTASRGNWRNSIYISGKDSPHGFLLAPDRDGKPVISRAAKKLKRDVFIVDETRGDTYKKVS